MITLLELNDAIKNALPLSSPSGTLVTASHLEIASGRVYCVDGGGLGSFYEMGELTDPAAGDSEYSQAVRWLRGTPESVRERENLSIADRAFAAELRLGRILMDSSYDPAWAAEDEMANIDAEAGYAEHLAIGPRTPQTTDF